MTKNNLITIKNLTKIYNNKNRTIVFKNLSLKLYKNTFYTFIGPSGCGKTTLLDILSKIKTFENGQVKYDQDYEKYKIGFVFQNDNLLPWKNVYENLSIVLKTHYKTRKQRDKIINKTLKDLNLQSLKESFSSSLSGGQKQRINLARSFVIDPDIIFMDEPFSHLDEITATNLRVELLKMWEKKPRTVIMATHNILEAVFLSDVIYLFDKDNNTSTFKKIIVDIPRPRNKKFLTEFIYLKTTKKIISKIFNVVSKSEQ